MLEHRRLTKWKIVFPKKKKKSVQSTKVHIVYKCSPLRRFSLELRGSNLARFSGTDSISFLESSSVYLNVTKPRKGRSAARGGPVRCLPLFSRTPARSRCRSMGLRFLPSCLRGPLAHRFLFSFGVWGGGEGKRRERRASRRACWGKKDRPERVLGQKAIRNLEEKSPPESRVNSK